MGWKHPFKSYAEMYDYVSGGRSPHFNGRKFTSAFRLFIRDGHIEIENHSLKLAKLYPDDTLEFVATTKQVWSAGSSLAMNMTKLLPVSFQNFATGRYKVVSSESLKARLPAFRGYTTAEYQAYRETHLTVRREAQEYFQGLILNLKTGEVVNPKDMIPVADEDKRKQWLAGLKSFRLRLRAMARVGAFDSRKQYTYPSSYFSDDDLRDLANAIMAGEVSEDIANTLCRRTSEWTARKHSSHGEAVVNVFENTVKSNSRQLRVHAGVISLKG